MTPQEHYLQDLSERGFQRDPAQSNVVEALDNLYRTLVNTPKQTPGFLDRLLKRSQPSISGLYIYGGVGRGKTYLMDLFFDALPFEDKRRIHFHRFMQQIHSELKALPKTPDPLDVVASQQAQKMRVLCLDEFHVSDIGDAMLLAGLLKALFSNGVTLVTTSNIPPDELYKNGLQRDRFLPAIALIKSHTRTMQLENGTDYRMELLERTGTYHIVNDETEMVLKDQMQSLAPDDIQFQDTLTINNRPIYAKAISDDVVWFEFEALCQTPRSASDYICIGTDYHTVIVSNIPILGEANDDVVQRFIHLIDALYDHNVKTIISAHAKPSSLYQGHRHSFSFQRTVSRLQEMASEQYLGKAHRA